MNKEKAADMQREASGCCLLRPWLLVPAACGLVALAFHKRVLRQAGAG